MNAGVIYTSREEVGIYKFSPVVTVGVPLAALFLQSFIPVVWHGTFSFFNVFDLPLLVVIFFAVARRNPVSGTVSGCLIGLAQDALTHNYIGLFGIAKSTVGYAASSIAAKIDVENPGARMLIVFAFYMLHRMIYLLVQRGLVQQPSPVAWLHTLGAALANGLLAIVVFSLLDRFKRRT